MVRRSKIRFCKVKKAKVFLDEAEIARYLSIQQKKKEDKERQMKQCKTLPIEVKMVRNKRTKEALKKSQMDENLHVVQRSGGETHEVEVGAAVGVGEEKSPVDCYETESAGTSGDCKNKGKGKGKGKGPVKGMSSVLYNYSEAALDCVYN